jgi:membrane protease YdiL (CAAX protease family)
MNEFVNSNEEIRENQEESFFKNPIMVALLFLLVSLIFRIIDIFVLKLDETPFNIIISKVVPLCLMLLYVGIVYKSLKPLGIHRESFLKNFILGCTAFTLFYGIDLLINFLIATWLNYNPRVIFSIFNIFYLFYFVSFLIINSFMEEGLFRGIMMRSFMVKTSKRTSNFLQAILFGLWHLVWPINSAINGNSSIFFTTIYAIYYVFFSFLFGFLAGYIFQKSSSLINVVVFHTLWNFFVSSISISYRVDLTIQEAVLSYIFETVSLVISFIVSMFLLYYILKNFNLPNLSSWDLSFSIDS